MVESEKKAPGAVYQLGAFRVEPDLNLLNNSAGDVHLEPINMDVLVHLIENAPRVVSADELLKRFWTQTYAEESTIHRRINQIRRALGDSARAPTYIETVRKRGYRIVAEAKRLDGTESSTGNVIASAPPQALRIAVLPFAIFSESASDSYLADGFHEDILSGVASAGLQVISRTSVARYAGRNSTVPVRTIADELDVSHVLEGSVRRSGDQLRVAVQLIDARRDIHLWASTYDRKLTDLFGVQRDVAREVADRLSTTFEIGQALADRTLAPDASAYDLVLQARAQMRVRNLENLKHAEQLLQSAIHADPFLAEAHALLAEALFEQTFSGAEWADVRARATRECNRALEIDPDSAVAHIVRARIAAAWEQDPDTATRHYERALTLRPNNTTALTRYASFLNIARGRADLALPYLRRALVLDPLSADVHYRLGRALMSLGDVAEASRVAARGLRFESSDRRLIELAADIAYARGDLFAYFEGQLQILATEPADPRRQERLMASLAAIGDLDAAERWVERIGRTSPTHIEYFNARRWVLFDRHDVAKVEALLERWRSLNSDRRAALLKEGTAVPFGTVTQAFLFSYRADEARAAADSDRELALRRSAVEIGTPVLKDGTGAWHISIQNIGFALKLAIDMLILGEAGDAAELLTAIATYPDVYNQQATVQFCARVLLGDVEAALEFEEARALNLQVQPLLDEMRANASGVYAGLIRHRRFASFYRAATARNAALRQRLRNELPSLIDASHGL